MGTKVRRFEYVTWPELIGWLSQLANRGVYREAGLQCTEVTDLMQAQLLLEHPVRAMAMPRVIELRFAQLGAVAYLRTGILIGHASASPEAGAFLLSLRRFRGQTGDPVYLRCARVKRTARWREHLARRIRILIRLLQAGGPLELQAADSIGQFLVPQAYDIERELKTAAEHKAPQEHWAPSRLAAAGLADILEAEPDLRAPFRPAGISLPVWMSFIASVLLLALSLIPR